MTTRGLLGRIALLDQVPDDVIIDEDRDDWEDVYYESDSAYHSHKLVVARNRVLYETELGQRRELA